MLKSKAFAKAISTFFGIGTIPFAPGTVGGLLGVAIYYFGLHWMIVGGWYLSNILIYLGILSFIFVMGAWASGLTEATVGKEDSPYIIIDEVVGYLVAMCGLPPEPFYIIMGFILFRILDIFKLLRLKALKGGLGIMLDDVLAGFITCIILHLVALLKGLFFN